MPVAKTSVPQLKQPVWFDTGLKMQDGAPRLVAAYDEAQLAEYKEKKSVTGYDEDGDEILVLWKKVAVDAPEFTSPPVEPVPGVTATTGRKRR